MRCTRAAGNVVLTVKSGCTGKIPLRKQVIYCVSGIECIVVYIVNSSTLKAILFVTGVGAEPRALQLVQ
jgi:hypothetical protein